MTAYAFVEWLRQQPSGRFELFRGEVVAVAPERVGHPRVKTAVLFALHAALAARGLYWGRGEGGRLLRNGLSPAEYRVAAAGQSGYTARSS